MKWGGRGEEGRGSGRLTASSLFPTASGRPAGWECEVGREGRGGEGEWEAHRQQPVPHSQPDVLLVGSVKWGGRGEEGRGRGSGGEGRGGEGEWEAHRQQPVPHSQPAFLLRRSSVNDFRHKDAVVSRNVLIADASRYAKS